MVAQEEEGSSGSSSVAASGKDALEASQRLQRNLQKMIDEAEQEEEQDKEMTDTEVALRRHGLQSAPLLPTPHSPHRLTRSPRLPAGAQKMKDQGNEAFKSKDYKAAARKYTSTLDILDQLDAECGRSADPRAEKNEWVRQRWALRVTALSNRAESQLQQKKWAAARKDAEAALEIDRYNEKALSRRRRARAGQTAEEEEEEEAKAAAEGKGAKTSWFGRKKPAPKPKPDTAEENKPEEKKYNGPTLFEVCLEQWPRTFGFLGRVGSVLNRYRGVLAVVYLAVTVWGARYIWRTGFFGLFGGDGGGRLTR